MARNRANIKADGIEIHHDEDGRSLSLACEPDAFATFRDFVRQELKDVPEIPVEKVISIEILDTAEHVARRDSPRSYLVAGCMVAAVFAVAIPWGVGIGLILRSLVRWISN